MDKRFDPKLYEAAWQQRWAEQGIFVCAAPSDKPPFCIMIPPPNVTGKLHMGHALQTTLQDLLTRWKRMQGYNALWLPGTDHAGIATQLMVERQLESEGTSRLELGRERFLQRTWEWKRHYHGNIRNQLDAMGASCDWSRERFTLDEGLSRAVREAFVRLHAEGLIHRGEYIVNWSPTLDTAISDLEVESRTVEGRLYHIAYPVEGRERTVTVVTTRPETMLGDTAVAYHPGDPRYEDLAGRYAILPISGRRVPFVADEMVEREFGSGLVKITPAHDRFDFELARRHGLPMLQVIDRRGGMTDAAGAGFAGLDRFAARRAVVERLESDGALLRVEPHQHNVGHSQRSGEPIEPLLSTQWFCNVSGMAAQALAAVRDGRLALVPATWEKTWEHWLENIQPWCVSRQLWWGHQIPAWYTPDGRVFVARSVEEAAALAGTDELTQDPDVLDTWFSSALWPFSTLGWPDDTPDLRTFYPTSVLVTGFDILFFWVARMAMTGLHFTGKSPFAAVHLTGLVRDAQGQKMSKTTGNVVDPERLIDEFGADAMRFTLAALDSPGRDIPLDLERMAGYRAFGNKLWNATRFVLGRVGEARVPATALSMEGLAVPERWILSRLCATTETVNDRFARFRFDEACQALYHFFWGDFCDWYIELAKPALAGEDTRPRVAEVLLATLEQALRLLHPVMPFLTEELWQRLPGHESSHPDTICLAPYPEAIPGWRDLEAEASIDGLMAVVNRVRALRTERGASAAGGVLVLERGEAERRMNGLLGLAAGLARVDDVRVGDAPTGAVTEVLESGVRFAFVEPAREHQDAPSPQARERTVAERTKLQGDIARAAARLEDGRFLAKAPDAVIAGNRQSLERMRERLTALDAILEEH